MKELTVGSYVDCRNLSMDQVIKLRNKWIDLVGDYCLNIHEMSRYSDEAYTLVYIEPSLESYIWFCDYLQLENFLTNEMFYGDFFPEESTLEVKAKTIGSCISTLETLQLPHRTSLIVDADEGTFLSYDVGNGKNIKIEITAKSPEVIDSVYSILSALKSYNLNITAD